MSIERIVIGVDLSPGCLAAVDWGVREARTRDAVVVLVHGVERPADDDSPIDFAGLLLTTFRDRARAIAPQVDLRLVVTHNSPGAALIDASARSDLLVLGSRGRAGFSESALGSIAQQVIVHAACPVVVVPPDSSTTRLPRLPRRIVAGLATTTDIRLLDCAADLARVRGATLELMPLPDAVRPHQVVARAATYLSHRYPGVRLEVARPDAGAPLTAAAHGAELLVIGCRHSDQRFGCRTGTAAADALVAADGPVVLVGAADVR